MRKLLCVSLLFLVGCSVNIVVPPATGDQSVFKELSIEFTANEYHTRLNSQRDENGVPPLELSHSLRIEIGNSLKSYGGVLKILVDGKEVGETGSAGIPQQFSYQYYKKIAKQGHTYTVEFRYKGASFSLPVQILQGTITSPSLDQQVSSQDSVVLKWSSQTSPSKLEIATRYFDKTSSGSCKMSYQAGAANTYAPVQNKGGSGPPCIGEAKATWTDKPKPNTPFRNFVMTRITSRTQPFQIR